MRRSIASVLVDSVSGSFYAILISDVGLTSQCVQVWVSLGVSTIKVEIVGGEWLTFYLGATATINSSTSWSVVQTSTAVVYGQPQGGTTVQKVVSGLKTTKEKSSKSSKSPKASKSPLQNL